MSGAKQQMGTITFGSVITGVWSTQDGLTYDGKSVEEIECTVDTDTTKTWLGSDLPDFGQFTSTIYVPSDMDLDAIVGTTETLTWTWPLGSDTTAKSISGSAILLSAPTTAGEDQLISASATFRWTGSTTTTAAT